MHELVNIKEKNIYINRKKNLTQQLQHSKKYKAYNPQRQFGSITEAQTRIKRDKLLSQQILWVLH